SVGVFIYDLSEPAAPQLIDVLDDPGITGIRGVGAGLLVWGRAGLKILGATQLEQRWPSVAQPVLDAAVRGRRLYVLTEEGLVSYSGHDDEPRRAPQLARSAHLVPGVASLSRRAGRDESRTLPRLPMDGVASIDATDGPARRHEVVLMHRDGSSLRYDV